jgi:uncharacterized GH25 family protein
MRLIVVALMVLFGTAVSAHETWIMPSTFTTKPEEEVRFDVTTGMEFPASETAVRPARIARSSWRLGKERGELTEFREGDKSLAVARAFPQPGVATVWVELKPRDIELSDEKVAEYLDEIGATEGVRKRWLAQKGRAAWKETYTKHAKTIVAVGDPAGDGSWGTPVGMKLELVPVSSPFAARSGQKYAVQLLLDGKPLPRWPVGLMVKGQKERVFETSDADGKATFSLRHVGKALIFAVHLSPGGEGQRWQSDFTTLTLRAR